jgi:hypothetical protein
MSAAAQAPNKQNTMTPEKARLLKAMKLREKKKLMSLQPTLDVPACDIPSAPSSAGLPEEKQDPEAAENTEETSAAAEAQQGDLPEASNLDSGVDVATDHASVDTSTDSHPPSPTATSEIGDSTQASSLSESTDETILAKDEHLDREANGTSDSNAPALSENEIPPSEANVDAVDSRVHDRQSQATITAVNEQDTAEDKTSAAPEDNPEQQPTASETPLEDLVSETSPISTSSEAPPVPDEPETVSAEAVDPSALTSATAETTPADTDPVQEETTPQSQIRVPLSKFSTQETKSPTGLPSQAVPLIVAHTSDVDSWRVGDLAPPVPEKDSGAETGEAAEAESKRRKLPDPIRTDLDAPDHDKRRSVISILDNDGFMDELQSATVQQATPITVAKSPISPFFSVDQNSKRVAGGSESAGSAPKFSRTVSNPVRNSFLAPGETTSGPVRSASSGAAYLQKISQQQTSADLRPKSAKLGSSISQRIKALEKLSGSAPGGDGAPKERPATTFFAVRKAGTRESSRPSSVVDMAGVLAGGITPSPPASRDSSPETTKASLGRGRSGSLVNRLSMFEGGMPPRGRPESVQVTARIVRDPSQPFPKAPESKGGSTEYAPLDLKQSPLLVDVHNRVNSRSPVRPPSVMSVRTTEQELAAQAKQTLLERRLSKQSQEGDKGAAKGDATDGPRPRRRSSLSVVKDFIKDRTESIIGAKSPSTDNLGNSLSSAPTSVASPSISRSPSRAPSVHQPGSLARRLSISSRRSSIDQNSPALSSAALTPGRTPDGGAESVAEAKSGSTAGDKYGSSSSGPASPNQGKTSRASRFMRRLSNTLTTGRKNGAPSISPTVAEENAAEVEAASRGSTATSTAPQSPPSIVAFMGDVNVQFPDNLLWKRRSICLDSQGFLILSAVQGTAMLPTGKDRHGAMVKRYHMTDFKPPYAPDVELQELPNSVVLDLVGGSGLQIACEDRAGQMSILRSKFTVLV